MCQALLSAVGTNRSAGTTKDSRLTCQELTAAGNKRGKEESWRRAASPSRVPGGPRETGRVRRVRGRRAPGTESSGAGAPRQEVPGGRRQGPAMRGRRGRLRDCGFPSSDEASALESGPRGATSSDSHSEDVTRTPCTARGRAV